MRFDDYLESLQDSASGKGLEFELEIEHWLRNDKIWSKVFVRVVPWSKWERAQTRDIGIDLVAEDLHGHFWAIQVKARPKSKALRKSEIDSFLSASSTSVFRERLLIATVDELGTNARATILAQEKPVRLVLNQDLREADFEWGNRGIPSQASRHDATKEPKLYQARIIAEAADGFNRGSRLMLQMACGTGKTFTAMRISEAIDAKLVILAVPSITLLSQAIADWLTDSSQSFNWLAVCSDSSVDRSEDGEYLADFTFPATTDSSEISKLLRTEGRRVIFSTYQSLPKVELALRDSGLAADLVIADEAHRLAGNPSETIRSLFEPKATMSKRFLFLTATPRIYKQGLSKSADVQTVISMDDSSIFGSALTPYTFSQAIEEKELTDFSVEIIGVSSAEVQDLIQTRANLRVKDVLVDVESMAIAIGTIRAIRKRNLTRLISFHSRVSKARNFTKLLPLALEIMHPTETGGASIGAQWLSGETPASKRKRLISELARGSENSPHLLANARCLTEGVNVPSLDGVVFVDPRTSEVDIIQAVGRAIRKNSGKSEGVIVLPVLISENYEDVEKDLSRSSYKAIWAVLNALKSHDPQFGLELDALREKIGRTDFVERTSPRLSWTLPGDVNPKILNAIQVRTIQLSSNAWFERFGYLVDYKAKYGHANPEQKVGFRDFSWLGAWLSQQRTKWTLGELSELQISKLESIGVVRDVLEYTWNLNYETLRNYLENQSSSVPQVLWVDCPPNLLGVSRLNIGQWLSVQTQAHRDAKLSEERFLKLDSLGISWKKIDSRWQRDLAQLERFFESNSRWPTSYDSEDGPTEKVNSWGQKWLSNFKRARQGALPEAKIEDLRKLGAPVDHVPEEKLWKDAFEDLREFHEQFGHSEGNNGLIGPRSGLQLRSWIYTQRRKQFEGSLSQERKLALDSLNFRWLTGDPNRDNLKNVAWWDCYDSARKFFEESGLRSEVPAELTSMAGRPVGSWVNRQRFRKRKDLLKDWQITALDQFGFLWDPRKKA